MNAIDFNQGWSYRHLNAEDEAFQAVAIPHDAMISESRQASAPSGSQSGWFIGRDYEYSKQFLPEPEFLGHTMILEFEGVYHRAEVWVNGIRVCTRPYGYTNFYVNLTNRLRFNSYNEIRVIAHNADQPNCRWYSGAGIYRPVTLWVGPSKHININGLSLRTLSVEAVRRQDSKGVEIRKDHGHSTVHNARVEVSVDLSEPASTWVEIRKVTRVTTSDTSREARRHAAELPGEETVGRYRFESSSTHQVMVIDIPEASLWSPESPNLYCCLVSCGSMHQDFDQSQTTFGIRTLQWGNGGLLINGERTILRGACVHHDNGILGASAWPDAEERKIRLLKANGYNAIRSAHNPCSKAMLEACDRLGMLVIDEYVDQWYIHKTQFDYVPYFKRWWRQDLKDMVMKDRNHPPSVIMYSIGNEVGETAKQKGIQLTDTMIRHLHTLDATRPVTCGVNILFNFLTSIGLGMYSDRKAHSQAEQASKAGFHILQAAGSEFYNNLAGLVGADVMKACATWHGCDLATREVFDKLDIAGYNYGIKRYEKDLRNYPDRLILGTETFCTDANAFYQFAQKHARVLGDFVWAGIDYLGETGIGAWEYADYAPARIQFGWLTAGSGRLDLTGKPLGEALYSRVALG